jgi:hypothetical protein
MMTLDGSDDRQSAQVVGKEFARTRRNRLLLTTAILGLGLGLVVLPDVAAGTLGIGSVAFLAVLALVYYRIMASKRREKANADSLPAIARDLQLIGHDPRGIPRAVGYHVMPDGWLIKRSLLTFDFQPISSVCWVFGKDVKHSVNFIPTGTSHEIEVRLRSGKTLKEKYSEKERDEKLVLLRRVAPWAIVGYNGQLASAWRKDRKGFLAEVDRRYRQILASRSSSA